MELRASRGSREPLVDGEGVLYEGNLKVRSEEARLKAVGSAASYSQLKSWVEWE